MRSRDPRGWRRGGYPLLLDEPQVSRRCHEYDAGMQLSKMANDFAFAFRSAGHFNVPDRLRIPECWHCCLLSLGTLGVWDGREFANRIADLA